MSDAMSHRILRYAGWSAYVCAVISFLGAILLSLFFMNIPLPGPGMTVGASPLDFGLLSDYSGLVADVVMIPLPLALSVLTYRQITQHRPIRRRWLMVNRIAWTLGSLGAVALLIGQALLVTGVMS